MNDLDLVRMLRATVPTAAPTRVAAGRDRLLASIASPSPRIRPPWHLALPVTAVAAAAAAAIVVLGNGGHPPAPSVVRPSAHPTTGGRISLSTRVLTIAADRVASEPVTEPHNGQWIYTKSLQTETGQAAQSDDNWIRFDGLETAYFQNAQLIVHKDNGSARSRPLGASALAVYDDNATPLTAYNALASLPSFPAAILTAVGGIVGTTPRE